MAQSTHIRAYPKKAEKVSSAKNGCCVEQVFFVSQALRNATAQKWTFYVLDLSAIEH
jgi:hypothetical protein